MRTEQQLVRIWAQPNKAGTGHTYYLRYVDLEGHRRCESLHHSDSRKAEKERLKKEKELRMKFCPKGSMRLSHFLENSLRRTGDQICPSTAEEYTSAMEDFIDVIGDVDFQTITLKEGEFYRQACLDKGNTNGTVAKKITVVKGFFDLAVERQQIEENPLKYLKLPKRSKKEIHTYSESECEQMVRAAMDLVQNSDENNRLKWDLVIIFGLSTALRRGEILNCVWEDIDFGEQVVKVAPKGNTDTTWEWRIKNTSKRTLPLTDDLTQLLIDHQSRQPEGYPYVFVPPARYDYIQNELRAKGKWKYSDSRLKVIYNFKRDFDLIKKRARIDEGVFHDFRKTAICHWFYNGISEFDVSKLAGHADFSTTHSYYLAVKNDLVDRARIATAKGLCQKLVEMRVG